MRVLHASGLIQLIKVPADATPSDLSEIITKAFGSVGVIAQGRASMYGASLLTKFSLGKGAPGVWRVYKTLGEFTVQDLEWCVLVSPIIYVLLTVAQGR
jgi:hypothetical protein